MVLVSIPFPYLLLRLEKAGPWGGKRNADHWEENGEDTEQGLAKGSIMDSGDWE